VIGRQFSAAGDVAAQTYTDFAVIAELVDDSWSDTTDELVRGGHVAVWEGPCSLSPPAGTSGRKAGDKRGADEDITTRTLRLPPDAPAKVGQRVYLDPPRDIVDLAELDETTCFVIARVDDRSNRVIQRVQVVALVPTGSVP